MTKYRPLSQLFAALALVAGLAACDSGGVGTSSNPDLTTSNSGFVYTGPAARNVDVNNFQFYLWNNLNGDNRCGGCHNSQASSPESPLFFDTRNVNVAYDASIAYVDLDNPSASEFVSKVGGGHNCWESNPGFCGTLITDWIQNWKNANNGGVAARQINLVPPDDIRDPGEAKSFPVSASDNGASSFEQTVYPILVGNGFPTDNCQECHNETAANAQAPFFASSDLDSAYEAAKSKMNIDSPAASRMVIRLREEEHNCWSNNCANDAQVLEDAIAAFAGAIDPTEVDPALVTSMALTLGEGIIASGGNRHETDQFALWEFKTGTGLEAFDTSGLDPAIHLALIGSVNWVGGYGLEFTGGRAQADTITSDKLYSYIQTTGEYAIEAWVIPSNVSQEDANIVSYSGGDSERNFTLGQNLYDYESFNRNDVAPPSANGDNPVLSTGDDGEEIAQANLQHVVVNFDPFATPPGRSIYVNAQRIDVDDTAPGSASIANVWDDGFAFVLGSEVGGGRKWRGQVKMVAMHNRALTPAQIQQNFDVGVGQKFFLMFYVGHHLGEDPADPQSFIVFEVAQFDSYSYLFNKPTFITLDPAGVTSSINIQGMRIGINGKEALAGQAYANLDVTVDAGSYDPLAGQELSSLGTIIALEKSASSDEFFLTFEVFGPENNAFTDISPSLPADPGDPADPVASDIGVRTFEEINSTIAEITGIPVTNSAVQSVYDDYIQQLPAVEDISAFLPSHQMAIAQLAMTSCSELVDDNPGFFAGFVFNQTAMTAFGPLAPGLPDATQMANRDLIIDPLLAAAMNVDAVTPANNLDTQPAEADISALLGSDTQQNLDTGSRLVAYDSLFTTLINTCTPAVPGDPCTPEDTIPRTAQIVKGVCAATTGAAVMLVQ